LADWGFGGLAKFFEKCIVKARCLRKEKVMRTSELTSLALDWAVAKCEGAYTPSVDTDIDGTIRINYGGMYPEWSTDWAQGGPIIEREGITVSRTDQKLDKGQMPWVAYLIEHLFEDEYEHEYQHGPTP
jgi:hypothetical protein